jgi:hypothetical protein
LRVLRDERVRELQTDLRRRLRIAQHETHRPAFDAARAIDRDFERAVRLVVVLPEKRGAARVGADHVDRVRLGGRRRCADARD